MENSYVDEMFNIGILSIATNGYLGYWKSMALSLAMNVEQRSTVHLYLFTDEVSEAELFASQLTGLKVTVTEIPSYGWPEATLYRYRIYSDNAEKINARILMHLDADMIVNTDFTAELDNHLRESEIALVSHPGFWRPSGIYTLARLYLRKPQQLYVDLKLKIFFGGLGSWEKNIDSLAFVPRRERRNYVCGGIWFGLQHRFIELVKELDIQVRDDESRGVLAVWHDESHLNNWASRNSYLCLSPEYCFDGTYPQLWGLSPFITAVDKKKAK